MSDIHIVIMAGGIGSRFWPLSTPQRPKQFLDILGTGKTLLQMTVERFMPLCPLENIWIVTSGKYVDLVREQIVGLPEENILAEPVARNTAPCIAYACWKIKARHPHANIVVAPSDAVILDNYEFVQAIDSALEYTTDTKAIVTIGIKPSRPEIGYGYIEVDPSDSGDIRKVLSFKEKPDLDTAKDYLEKGNFLWNAGIFVWNVDTIVGELREYAPSIAETMDEIAEGFYTEREKELLERLFPTCEKISIDYAVMEKSPYIYTIESSFGWSDLGTWGSLQANAVRDHNGNAVVGSPTELHNCHDCIIDTDGLDKVIIEGLDGYIVAHKSGHLMICRLSEEQKIRDFVR